MRVLRVFFLGLIYGWFMRWIIDEIYGKDHLRMITNENTLLRERIRELEAPQTLTITSEQRPELPEPVMPPQLAAPPQPVQAMEPAAPAMPVPQRAAASNRRDDLKLIKGIGPKLEKKLHEAGVTTFDQMSRLTTAELQAILGLSKRVEQNADNLISQAKQFAEDHRNG